MYREINIQQRERKNTTIPRRYLDKDILPYIGNKPIRCFLQAMQRSNIPRQSKIAFQLILMTPVGGVRGISNRAVYAAQRKGMQQAWADFIDGLAQTSNLVVALGES